MFSNKMVGFWALVCLSLYIVFSQSQAAVIDNDEQMTPEELQEYVNELQGYLQYKDHSVKRGRFCLRRDMTCPNLENGKDFCCRGSQCSCNLFGQNCRCSTIGLFQRLGKR